MTVSISIVIPVAPGETRLENLIGALAALDGLLEITVVATEPNSADQDTLSPSGPSKIPLHWIISPSGRARQMNRGAAEARGDYLWFLHADTVITPKSLEALQNALQKHPDDLLYFDLIFTRGGPSLMPLNSWGVWIRSHWFKMPFGDQGFCLSKKRFHELGGYDESLPFGEDHAFVWTARMSGMKVRPAGAGIETSARKYQTHGWCRTTLRHFWLTWKQALPRYGRLLRKRWFG
jgi:rSAM/selenodomain-associated transferase 2